MNRISAGNLADDSDLFGRTPRVLVVEDDLITSRMVQAFLQQSGYSVNVAMSIKETMAGLSNERPDLILLDISLPDGDGFGVCEHLKQETDLAEIPVIFMSSSEDIETKIRGFEVGGVDYITKPVAGAELIARVATHLRLQFTHENLQMKSKELNQAYQKLKASQMQILQQEKMASIGQLAAGIAHEINNPIGFVSSNLSSMQRYMEKLLLYQNQLEEWLSAAAAEKANQFKKQHKIDFIFEDLPELLEESKDGVSRVRTIVQNLKSFSRVDQVELSEVDINSCLESTIAIAWNEIKYKSELQKDFSELPLLECYPQQLNQVFLNILMNAAQAIEKNGLIKIRTYVDNDSIAVAISDNGSGIPEQYHSRIFEPFFTTKDVGSGTGLGMSISYEIIKRHHGNIIFESKAGEGTTFTILLPLHEKAENCE